MLYNTHFFDWIRKGLAVKVCQIPSLEKNYQVTLDFDLQKVT